MTSACIPLLQTPMSDNPKVAAMQDAMRRRVAAQEEKETKGKQELTQQAAKYLENFYEVWPILLAT